MSALLEIKDLYLDLMSTRGIVHALNGVNMSVGAGEIHGLVGESGCGKSMTSRSILRLHNEKRSRIRGEILFNGEDLLTLPVKQMRQVRGDRISLIFQDPMTSLNPLLTIGQQLSEVFRLHKGCSRAEARERSLELLSRVGISPPEKRFEQYPHELSGGLQQRVMIAMAIANEPDLLIADEPTTALDVTIQAQILELLQKLQADTGMSILLITHNFGLVAEVCHRVSVMYAGEVVETADVESMFHNPLHPYSRVLIASIPQPGGEGEYLPTIAGNPPELYHLPEGCSFAPRCEFATELCREQRPEARPCGDVPGHLAACHRLDEQGGD